MQYEIAYYSKRAEFQLDMDRRYHEVIAERHPMSYDRFWKIEHVLAAEEFRWIVIWSRPAPLRKS